MASSSKSSCSEIETRSSGSSRSAAKRGSRASQWDKKDLKKIGLDYADDPTLLNSLVALLKAKIKDTPEEYLYELPEISYKIIELTKEIFTISFRFSAPLESRVTESTMEKKMHEFIQEYNSILNDVQDRHKGFLGNELDKNLRIFHKWRQALQEFLNTLQVFLVRWRERSTSEATFRHLFMQFTRICLMIPEPGEAYTAHLQIGKESISVVPDIRFTTPYAGKGILKVITVTEMKNQDADKVSNDDSFHIKQLRSRVLGQHGAELLAEWYQSFFRPAVSGMICIGTKLILTYLETDSDSLLNEIGEKRSEPKATVEYTRPYDFMDYSDRNEILEALFWLGFVQQDAYNHI